MSLEKAKHYLEKKGLADRIMLFDESTATVPLAAAAIGCEEGMIAKTISLSQKNSAVLVVTAGDCKIDNRKYKDTFKEKATMLSRENEAETIGHEIGGVCPFGINDGIRIYLDISLKEYETVYPAAGNANSAVRLTPDELFSALDNASWVDVCKKKDALSQVQ